MTIQCLTRNELSELTHKIRPSAQARVLGQMGIEHKVRPDGSIAVLQSTVLTVMGSTDHVSRKNEFSVNFDDVR